MNIHSNVNKTLSSANSKMLVIASLLFDCVYCYCTPCARAKLRNLAGLELGGETSAIQLGADYRSKQRCVWLAVIRQP